MNNYKQSNQDRLIICSALLVCLSPTNSIANGNLVDYMATPPLISSTGATDKPNVLVVLDNSNSMDEAANGSAVGSANSGSKSEIARNAVKDLITAFDGKIRMGLMAYQQSGVSLRHLHNAPYDCSYDISNYNPSSTDARDSLTKKYQTPNPTNPGSFIYYNIALPFYSNNNEGNAFCYSPTADFDNGSETAAGPFDDYRCFNTFTGITDPLPVPENPLPGGGITGNETAAGYASYSFNSTFFPTDSDFAQNIFDFGTFLSWTHVSETWFSNNSPGKGFLHIAIDDIDSSIGTSTQIADLNATLATSQFATSTDIPLRNAGLTPLQGTLQSAKDYFDGALTDVSEGGSSPAPTIPVNICGNNDFVVLLTDGLPSTDASGSATSDVPTAISDTADAAAALLTSGVNTYVVGFALPEGVDPTLLDSIASAGGTSTAFSADDPATLASALNGIFLDILNRTSSATGAAVVSNNSSGVGAVYQALYNPRLEDLSNNVVTWAGSLFSLFIDDYGLLREDGNQNAQLDDYSVDKVINIFFDSTTSTTRLRRLNSASSAEPISLTAEPSVELKQLKPIWSAKDQLSVVSDYTTQRNYTASADSGRHILTWLDNQTVNNTVDTGEVIDFTAANFGPLTFNYLDIPSAEAADLVNYIRGEEIAGHRPRLIDYDGNGSTEKWLLGDIIHSTPAIVGEPADQYDTFLDDTSYKTFAEQYKNRRQMIYVGANDGMIHAFNGGFWNNDQKKFSTELGALETPAIVSGLTTHPLGSELWSYVPMNLLPHLKWLKDSNYPHVYYVDGEPKVFDANIFTADSDHPGGWGTVLVIGMRLGGGEFTVGAISKTMRSAYIVLDITNPEVAPKLIAEITAPDLGYTTSIPSIIKFRTPGAGNNWANPAQNEWYLAFGSGPDTLSSATSTKTAKLYMYDLQSKSFVANFAPYDLTTETTSFVGDLSHTPLNITFNDSERYFGTVGGTPTSPTGTLKRLNLNSSDISSSTISDVFSSSVGQPFISSPLALYDNEGKPWIYAGTGRLYVEADNISTSQQTFYGIREPLSSVDPTDILDVTDIEVFSNGLITPLTLEIPSGTPIPTYDRLKKAIAMNKQGWKIQLDANGTNPSTRNLNTSNIFGPILLFTSYTPSSNLCEPEGESHLFAVDYQTGTAFPHAAIGLDGSTTLTSDGIDYDLSLREISLGQGFSSSPVVHTSKKGGSKVFTQQSTGALTDTDLSLPAQPGSRLSWKEIPLQ